jgi:tetratricopeptide (TPR) repeat protein
VAIDSPGAVVVTEAVASFLARRFALQPLHDPERRALRLLHREGAPPAANLVPFVGRALELDTLRQAAARAEQHRGQVVGIAGDAGLGKSRLLHEATRQLRGWRVLQSAGAPYARTASYFPIVELLKRHCYVEDTDTASAVQAKVTAALSHGVGDPAEVTPPVLDLLAVLPADDPFRQLEPAERRRRTLDAMKRLILAASTTLPLCLIVEDLHWIDPETEAVLDCLVESIAASRVLLLVNYRPEYRHRWSSKTYCRQLQLEPLSGESAEQFVRALLGEDPAVQPLAAHLTERTEGNPFFLEESVTSLVEAGVLGGQRGTYRLTRTPPRVEIPSTVQALLSARIDRLTAEDKQILETAAVIGKRFSLRLLQAISDQEPEALRPRLAALQAAEFIYETTVVPDVEYTFKHALTHEVAYEGMLDARRRALHAAVMDAMRQLYGERLDDHVERLAHHAVRGEQWEQAVAWCRRAAARAASRSAYVPAASHLEQALAALGHLAPTRTTTEQAVDIRLDLRELLVPLGEQQRNLDQLQEALPLALALGDPRRLGRVYLSLATAHWLLGEAARGLGYGEQAHAAAEEIGDPLLRMRSRLAAAVTHYALGNYRQGIHACEATLELLDGEVARERFGIFPVYTRAWFTFCLAQLGDFARAHLVAGEAAELARANGRPESLVAAQAALGAASHLRGDLTEAIAHLERGLDLCRQAGIGVWLNFLTLSLGRVYALSGRPAEAQRLLDESLALARTKTRVDESLSLAWLGEAHLQAGRPAEALDAATRGLEVARQQQARGTEAVVRHVLGEIASSAGPPDSAAAGAHYRASLTLAEEIGMQPLVAHCHTGLARLCRKTGDPSAAEAHLATAAALYRGMGMAYWLEQASIS